MELWTTVLYVFDVDDDNTQHKVRVTSSFKSRALPYNDNLVTVACLFVPCGCLFYIIFFFHEF